MSGGAILSALIKSQDSSTRLHLKSRSLAHARRGITAPISSVTNLEQLDELLESVNLKLDHSSVDLLDKAGAY